MNSAPNAPAISGPNTPSFSGKGPGDRFPPSSPLPSQEDGPWVRPSLSAEALKAEVQAWADRIGVTPREIHVRPMTSKWASCSSKGRLTFDTGLLSKDATFRAEVIVHELLHMKVPNHGRLFRSLARAYLGGLE